LADSNFELLAPVPFSTVVFRLVPLHLKNAPDEDLNALNNRLLDQINQTGKVFLSHTKLRGKFALRLAIGNLKTTWADCELAWEIIQQTARQLIAAAKS
jgi:glutamate/tyrosine decarboxylase-like PLP-dependent enzyme